MATHDLKPKDVIRTLDIQFLRKKKDDKHEERQKKPVPESKQNKSNKEA